MSAGKQVALRYELEAIASVELADVLVSWGGWDDGQRARLVRYLRDELADGGMLSAVQLRDAGAQGVAVRRQAWRLVRGLS